MKNIVRLFLCFICGGIVISMILQMIVANHVAVYGEQLGVADLRIRQMEEQNDYLRQLVTTLSSINRVEREARKKGLTEAKTTIVFDTDMFPIAQRR